MIDERDLVETIEVERYELSEAPAYNFTFDRRDFIKAFGLGIVFIVPAARVLAQQRGQGESGRGGGNNQLPNDIDAWIHIDEKGEVTGLHRKVEVGQNTRTSLIQAIADELHVPLRRSIWSWVTPISLLLIWELSAVSARREWRRNCARLRLPPARCSLQWPRSSLKLNRRIYGSSMRRFLNHDKSKTLTLAEVAKGPQARQSNPRQHRHHSAQGLDRSG
jgi:hypothetical protein